MRRALGLVVLLWAALAGAEGVPVALCYNYGCNAHAEVVVGDAQLERIGQHLHEAQDAATERAVLAKVIGELYRIAGEQTPVGADRAGNYRDEGGDGRMDCIDHSTNTTRFLLLLEAQDMLRFHRALPPARRTSFIITQHFSAVIEEIAPPARSSPGPQPGSEVPALFAVCDCVEAETELPAPEVAPTSRVGERYAVDSWFVDNGEAAIVLPLTNWLNGEGPNVQ